MEQQLNDYFENFKDITIDQVKEVLISKLLLEKRNYISGYGDFIVGFYTPPSN